ncbi:MAG: ABC transporter substrate-binding protein [Candidatus Thorarchaeota archaeon]
MQTRLTTVLVSLLFIMSIITVTSPMADAAIISNVGGSYVDKIVYNVITQDDQQVLALMDDQIDLIGDMVDPTFLATLLEAEDIDVANVQRNGYGHLIINTQKYPLNNTELRRALAFALDKEGISDTAWDGLSQPLDSPVPMVNPYTIEGQLPYTYYEANVALGNQLLDAAGFAIDGVTGFRTGPNGDPFDIVIECDQNANIAIESCQYAVDALDAMSIDAVLILTDYYEFMNRLYYHGEFDIIFQETDFDGFDVNWLAYEFWSEFIDEPFKNYAMFANATYDSWRDQLLHATTYEEVYEAAIEMQEILIYQCPIIVCYENQLLSAYRTDRFEGHVNDVSDGVPSWWTNYKVHLKASAGGPYGGTFRWSNPMDIDTFNFMVSSSPYADNINMMMWDSLIKTDGDGDDANWLAESYIAETHADNPEVPDGYTQFTFDMIQNATWSDGTPLTAEDVAFSLNYFRDSPGNPYGPDLSDMTAAYAPTTYRLIVQFSSVSFWHLHTVSYKPILPKHVFTIIGLDAWNLWDPNPPVTAMVTSGPFNVTDYVAGEFCELTWNPNYFYSGIDVASPPTLATPSSITYVLGTTGHSILWEANEDNPWLFSLYLDNSMSDSGNWDGDNIITNIDGLSLGVHIYEMYVFNTDAQHAYAVTTVTVVRGASDGTPVISSPDDISYNVGETGNNISWTAEDNVPFSYTIYQNGTIIERGDWDESPQEFTINVDGLSEGSYKYMIIVYDGPGEFATDTVFVTVVDNNPFPDLEDLGGVVSIGITIGSVAVILVVSVVICRSKQEGQWTAQYGGI